MDFEDLIAHKTDRTRAVFLIHYFGWQQPTEKLRRWCDEQGLFLIEDCALALFSSGHSGAIGRMGDAAIFSLPKSLGFVHGGLLSLASPPKEGLPCLSPAGAVTWLREIRQSLKAMAFLKLDRLGLYGALVSTHRQHRLRRNLPEDAEALPDMPGSYYFNPVLDCERALHPSFEVILNTLRWEQVIRARRNNYTHLATALENIQGVELLFPQLPPGICPLSLPLLVSNRNQHARLLQARGIAAYPWWAGFHQGALDWSLFPEACWLKRHVLTVPVYQGMDARSLDKIAEIIEENLHAHG
jgi:dTDP-4-amino-4,6-dideoxygalactose transaminase